MIWLYFIQLFHLHHVIHLFQFIFFKVKTLLMTKESSKAPPLYPKTHLLAASGIAALLSLALLVFPSREAEAKKTYLGLELDTGAEEIVQKKDNLLSSPGREGDSPFAQIENASAPTPPPTDPSQKSVTVSNGDTLSTLFNKVGLSATDLHAALNSSKDAKAFSRLKVGQVLEFKLTPEGRLQSLHS